MLIFLLGVIVGLLVGMAHGAYTMIVAVHKGILKELDKLDSSEKIGNEWE